MRRLSGADVVVGGLVAIDVAESETVNLLADLHAVVRIAVLSIEDIPLIQLDFARRRRGPAAAAVHAPEGFGMYLATVRRALCTRMANNRAEEIPVDAYTGYMMRLSEARTSELRRQAAEYSLSRASSDRTSLWTRTVSWLKRPPVLGPVAPAAPPLILQPAERRPTA